MAFKLIVDYQKLSLVVETDATEPTTTFIYAKSPVTYQSMQALSAYELFALSDVYLDPDTLNLWFSVLQDSPDALTVTLSEALVQSTSLVKVDTASIAEALSSLAFSLSKSETLNLSDSASLLLTYQRSFYDSPSISEVASRSVSLVASDAFTLDDTSSVSDVLKTDVYMVKGNVATLSESSIWAASLAKSESLSMAESSVFSLSSAYSDSIAISESLSILVVGRVLNSAVLNASVLN